MLCCNYRPLDQWILWSITTESSPGAAGTSPPPKKIKRISSSTVTYWRTAYHESDLLSPCEKLNIEMSIMPSIEMDADPLDLVESRTFTFSSFGTTYKKISLCLWNKCSFWKNVQPGRSHNKWSQPPAARKCKQTSIPGKEYVIQFFQFIL